MFNYLKFLLKSTNAHGVHSPFVFNYLTRCLYRKSKKTGDTIADLVLRSWTYFGFETLHVEGNLGLQQLLKSESNAMQSERFPVDLLYFETIPQHKSGIPFSDFALHNDSLVVIANIHKQRNFHTAWEKLIKHPKITVSIDLFCCGLLFMRKEQVKQHFYIRL